MFTFGLGSAGQLGHGGTKNLFQARGANVITGYNWWCYCLILQPTLVSVVRDKRVVFAAAGACHSILLDSCGKAYTCGKGRGLLGHGNTCMCTVPTCVESLQVMQLPYECNCTCKRTMICKNIQWLHVSSEWDSFYSAYQIPHKPYPAISTLQGVHVVRAAAGVARSIFISSEGVGYWCSQGSGELHDVRISNEATRWIFIKALL